MAEGDKYVKSDLPWIGSDQLIRSMILEDSNGKPYLNIGGSSAPILDSDATAYLESLPVTPRIETQNLIRNEIFPKLKSGEVKPFDHLDFCYISAVDYRQNAYFSLKNPALFVAEEQGSMLWNQWGFKGAVNSHVKSNYRPALDAINLQTDSTTIGYFSLTELDNGGAVDIGAQDQTAPEKGLLSFARGGNTWYASVNDDAAGSDLTTGITSTYYKHIEFKRVSSDTIVKFIDKVLVDTITKNSTGLTDLELFMFGLNTDGLLRFTSERQIPIFYAGDKYVDTNIMYDVCWALVNGMAAIHPTPDPLTVVPINNPILSLNAETLVDSVAGKNSTLGDNPSGFTTPSHDGDGNLDFNGLQTIKINDLVTLSQFNIQTFFIFVYLPNPVETTMQTYNSGKEYAMGLRNYKEYHNGNDFSTNGVVYYNEGPSDRPIIGRSLVKLNRGYHLFGMSISETYVYMLDNNLVSYFNAGNNYPAGGSGGTIGAFPGGTVSNMYTLPAYFKWLKEIDAQIYNYSATKDQLISKSADLMFRANVSLFVLQGDSISQGFTLTSISDHYFDKLVDYLQQNTSYKWAPCNIGIGGRTLNEAASQNQVDSSVTFNWTETVVITPVKPILGNTNKNIILTAFGVNDIAAGRTLQNLKDDITFEANYRYSQGWTIHVVFTVTADSTFDSGKEAIRLSFNAWLKTQESTLHIKVIDVCSIPGANTCPMDASLINDTVHWNEVMNDAVFELSKNIIASAL